MLFGLFFAQEACLEHTGNPPHFVPQREAERVRAEERT